MVRSGFLVVKSGFMLLSVVLFDLKWFDVVKVIESGSKWFMWLQVVVCVCKYHTLLYIHGRAYLK